METNSSNKIARILSTLLVPPSFSIIIFTLFVIYLESAVEKKIILSAVVLIFGFLAPIFLFLYLKKKGKLVDIDATIKEERTFPFLISILIYSIGFIVLLIFRINPISTVFWFCYISNTAIIIFINKTWKISIHAMGAAGPTAALVYAFGLRGFLMVPVIILVAWSRVKLKCHTNAQVIAGGFLGFITTYLQLFLLTKYF